MVPRTLRPTINAASCASNYRDVKLIWQGTMSQFAYRKMSKIYCMTANSVPRLASNWNSAIQLGWSRYVTSSGLPPGGTLVVVDYSSMRPRIVRMSGEAEGPGAVKILLLVLR